MKRAVDFVLALSALIVLAPVLLAITVAIRWFSPGPALFRQARVGRGGRTFPMLKFRSMVLDAGRLGSFRTATDDPRITPIGRLLRRTSLDELPQLVNVLRGDMSLVGPRPFVPAQQAELDPTYWEVRHRVRPGITGLAQVSGRSELTPDQLQALDERYVREQSLRFDASILLRTVTTVLAGVGGRRIN